MNTKATFFLLLSFTIWNGCFAPPVTKNKQKETEKEDNNDNFELAMHYHRYLKEVVGTLESDMEFKKKLEAADEADIRSGKIANELEFVSHHIRTRLDEIKRQELDRLKTLKKQLNENEVVDDPNHGHLDRANPHTFEIEDLKKLIAKTTEDLAEADKKRREEFKQYEMQKELEKFEKLNHTNGDERVKLEKEYEDLENKHKKHQPLHEPGHKAQLEEVWEEQDHMQQEFNPKAFFMMHDLDSNGLWDQDEVKALFVKELDKMYAAGAPEDDMRERIEEMERMREQVFQEVDLNRDNFIDFYEFLAQTKKQDFQQDNGWKGLDEQKPYTDQELEAFIRQHQMQQGYPPPGAPYHSNQIPQYQGHPNAYPQGHPNAYPQGNPNAYPQGHPNAYPQGHPNAYPQGNPQHQQGQMPPSHGQFNQPSANRLQDRNQQPPSYQNHQPQQQFQANPGQQQQFQANSQQQQFQANPGQQQFQANPGQQQQFQANPQQQEFQVNPAQQQQILPNAIPQNQIKQPQQNPPNSQEKPKEEPLVEQTNEIPQSQQNQPDHKV